MNIRTAQKLLKSLSLILLISIIIACSSSNNDNNPAGNNNNDSPSEAGNSNDDQNTTITRIEITPGTAILSGLNEKNTLSIKAFNQIGEQLDITDSIKWISNKPDIVSVNEAGEIIALQNSGSAIITAEIASIKSEPVTVFIVQPAQNSVFIKDEQVLSEPTLEDPSQDITIGTRYSVAIDKKIAVAVGDILLGSESQAIGGRVVEINDKNDERIVTLELLPLNEMFGELKIDEIYEIDSDDIEIASELENLYDMVENADGSFSLRPKSSSALSKIFPRSLSSRAVGTPTGTRANPFHPLDCSSSLPTIPITFNALPISDNLNIDLDLIIQYDSANEGLQKLALVGEIKAGLKVNPTLDIAFEGKVTCELTLVTITVPVGGPVAMIFGAQIPIGAGFEVGGKMTLAQVGAEVFVETKMNAEIGVIKSNTGWEMLNTANGEAKADYKMVLPDANNIDAQFRIEPALKGYVFSKLAMGNRFFSALQFDTFKISGGLVESAALGTIDGQIADTGFNADYKQSLNFSGGLGSDATNVFALLDINVAAVSLNRNIDLYTSPQLESAQADVGSFTIGDNVQFNVKLKPNTLDYLSLTTNEPYNIDEIIIYRVENFNENMSTTEIARTSANFAQAEFTLDWVADFAGNIGNNFYAFVDTKALRIPFAQGLDLPLLDELELGKVSAPSQECSIGDDFERLTYVEIRGFSEVADESTREQNNGPASPIFVDVGVGSAGFQASAQYGNVHVNAYEEEGDVQSTSNDPVKIVPNNADLVGQPAIIKAQVFFSGNADGGVFRGHARCTSSANYQLSFNSAGQAGAISESGTYEIACRITLGERFFLNLESYAEGNQASMSLSWQGMTLEDVNGIPLEFNTCSGSETDYRNALGS